MNLGNLILVIGMAMSSTYWMAMSFRTPRISQCSCGTLRERLPKQELPKRIAPPN